MTGSLTEVDRRPKVGVGVLVLKEGKVLLGERFNTLGEGTWAAPGGHLEFGETPRAAAIRELAEETGLVATKVRRGPWTSEYFEEKGKHFVSLFMVVEEFEGVIQVMEPHRCRRWEWFPFDKLPSPLFLPLTELLSVTSLEALT